MSDDLPQAPDRAQPSGEVSAWPTVLLAAVVVLAILLGTGRDTWCFGAISGLLGLTVVLCPPRFRLPKLPALCLLALALFPGVGLLPVSWFGGAAEWRESLWSSWGIDLSNSLSPVPTSTLESWLSLLVLLVWTWLCLAHGASESGRRWGIYLLALGGGVVAVASWVDLSVWPVPWWPRYDLAEGNAFGPFANRNHTASLNAIACVLSVAAAYDARRRRSLLVWLFVLAFLCSFAAVMMNTSRGGLLLLSLGLVVWAVTAAMKKGTVRKLAVSLALMIVVGSIASVSGGKLGNRIRSILQEEKSSPLSSSMRVDLARQVLNTFKEDPWVGQGLGTFSDVFPQVSTMHNSFFKFRHPESDFLLMLFEGGLLMGVPCGVLLFWIASVTGPWKTSRSDKTRDRSGRRLRQAAAVAAGMALVHSIFDMPNHILAYGMQTALLLGLAVRPQELLGASGVMTKTLARGLGLGVVGLGVVWLGIGFQQWMPDLRTSVFGLREKAIHERKEGRLREAIALVDRCIWLSPMDFRLYYFRAQLLLQLRQKPERALVEFGRARALEPDYAATCYTEGEYWLRYAPEMAMIPWRECLQREALSGSTSTWNFRRMVSVSGSYPELWMALWNLANSVEKQMLILEHAMPGPTWDEYFAKFLKKHPQLDQLEHQHLRLLLKLWHERGDREQLVQLLESNPDLQAFGWRTLAIEMARQGRYDEALLVAKKFLKRPGKPPIIAGTDLSRLERAFVFNPTDVRPGVELYFAQRAAGDLKGARMTAEKVNALPDAPAYMKVELAVLYAELKDPRRAWELMEQAMEMIPDT